MIDKFRAEIERLMDKANKGDGSEYFNGAKHTLITLLDFLDTLEEEPVELEKEIDKTVNECTDGYNFDWDKFALHFYELGRNSLKPEKWSDADEECRKELIQYIEQRIGDGTTGQALWNKWHRWLKDIPNRISLRTQPQEL